MSHSHGTPLRVTSFTAAVADWFKREFSEFNIYLIPLSFVRLPARAHKRVINGSRRITYFFPANSRRHRAAQPATPITSRCAIQSTLPVA